jgi:aspartate/methionine/tyrosine aminotransferase
MFSRRTGWKLTPNRFTQVQHEIAESGREVLDLTVSNPTRVGLAYDAERILKCLSDPAALDYDPQPRGLCSAREAVADYYREQHNAGISPEAIILTTSTSEAYSHVFRLLCNPDDEILVPTPSYPLFEFLAELQDVRLAPYPLIYDHGWQIDFHSLSKLPNQRTRAVVMVHPNNPTGSYINNVDKTALNDFCRKNNLALIVDEVFLDYPHDGSRRPSFVANEDVLTFTLSGLSKISALPQMKLGWIVTSGPREKVHAAMDRLEIIADTYLSVSTPVQVAAPTLLDLRRSVQPMLLDRIRRNLTELDAQLLNNKSCCRLEVEGGWYTVIRVPVTQSDEDFAIELVRGKAVLVHPGHFYDFSSDGYLVLSLITPADIFSEGLRRILQAA